MRLNWLFPLPVFAITLALTTACAPSHDALGSSGPETSNNTPAVKDVFPAEEGNKPKTPVFAQGDKIPRLSIASPDAYEPLDNTQPLTGSLEKSVILTVGAVQQHTFYESPLDWVYFYANANTTYVIETHVIGYADTVLGVYDGQTLLSENDDKAPGDYGSKITFKAPETKVYTIRTRSYAKQLASAECPMAYTLTLTTDPSPAPPEGFPNIDPTQPKKWTVMVYLDGNNNLSSATDLDIQEMEQCGSSADINIVALWHNGDDRHGYYYVDHERTVLLQDVGSVNMGSPQTVKDFLHYTAEHFPAEKTLFIFWNHGGAADRRSADLTSILKKQGISRGVCWDDVYNAHLSEADQLDAIRYGNRCFGKKIDVVGYDACLMAIAEVFYQLKDVTDFVVASEESVPGEGWDYTFLNTLRTTPKTSPLDACKAIATGYAHYYATSSGLTLSVANLAYADAMGKALNDFATAASTSNLQGTLFRDLASSLPFFGSSYTKDLVAFLNRVMTSEAVTNAVKDKAKTLRDIITQQLIVHEWHHEDWDDKAFGCAITMKANTSLYGELKLCQDTAWSRFCNFARFPSN